METPSRPQETISGEEASNGIECGGRSSRRSTTLQSPARVEGHTMTKASQQLQVPQEKFAPLTPSNALAIFKVASAALFACALALAPAPAFAQHGGGGGGGSHGGGGGGGARGGGGGASAPASSSGGGSHATGGSSGGSSGGSHPASSSGGSNSSGHSCNLFQ